MNIITALLNSLNSLIILRPLAIKFNVVDYPTERKNHAGNIPLLGGLCGFLGLLILLLTVSSGLAILLIGSFIEKNFTASSFPVFLIFFLFYLFIKIYNNSQKIVKRY